MDGLDAANSVIFQHYCSDPDLDDDLGNQISLSCQTRISAAGDNTWGQIIYRLIGQCIYPFNLDVFYRSDFMGGICPSFGVDDQCDALGINIGRKEDVLRDIFDPTENLAIDDC